MIFIDRRDAGRQLAGQLADQSAQPATAVFGLPRGGLVIADEIATAYHLPLEAVICRKLPAPGNPEYAIGAIAENADPVLNEAALVYYGIEGEYVDHVVEEAHTLIKQSILRWRSGHFLPELRSIRAILVDDGAATGLTMLAAIGLLRSLQVQEIIVALPVAPPETIEVLFEAADQAVCLKTPEPFQAVGRFYQYFDQTADEEVEAILTRQLRLLPYLEGSVHESR